MTEPTRLEVRCPNCGSTDIRERNVAYAELRVLGWERDGDVVIPDSYDTEVDVEWEAEDRSDQYRCHSCTRSFGLDDLSGEEVPDV
ncbi:MAG: hypothetical protein HOQ34_18430 [Gemmatimonadaceae bacterium]|nr:hypothetical protein [Gemmatimonadaceae bacterium]